MLQRKLDRAMDWLKNKNNNREVDTLYNEENEDMEYDPKADYLAEENVKIHLEDGDLAALILSAMMVFLPVVLILIIIFILILKW